MTSTERRNVIIWVGLAFGAGLLVGNLGAGGGLGGSPSPVASAPVVPPPTPPPATPASPAPAPAAAPPGGSPAASIPRLRQAAEAHPGDADAWVALGNAYFDAHQPPQAVEAYERALTLRPGDPNVLTDLGVMYRRLGKPREAAARFQAAAAAAPTHIQSRYNLGVVYFNDLHDVAKARAAWEDFLRVAGDEDPRAASVRAELARLGSGSGSGTR